jgi:hypothetical protein
MQESRSTGTVSYKLRIAAARLLPLNGEANIIARQKLLKNAKNRLLACAAQKRDRVFEALTGPRPKAADVGKPFSAASVGLLQGRLHLFKAPVYHRDRQADHIEVAAFNAIDEL